MSVIAEKEQQHIEEKEADKLQHLSPFNGTLPIKGYDRELLLSEMLEAKKQDSNWRDGKTWSLVYHKDEEHEAFIKKAYSNYFSENYLNPMAFSSLRRFEHEVVRMCVNLMQGDSKTVGTITSGGTESILLAIKTYRDRARAKHRFLNRPNMIVPETVHVAFDKAAHYFDVELIRAPLNKDKSVDLKAVRKLINRNTILLVGSAPNYPYGTIDDISALGKLAQKHRLPLHVDCCVGGFMLPFIKKLGHATPAFDFSVPGVTSISADIHKYGYAAKGASVILYKNMSYLKHQFVVCADWCGGVYASPTLLGTRPGGSIAAAWAAMNSIGHEGYLKLAEETMEITQALINGINAIEGLEVIGDPRMTIFAYISTDADLNVFAVADLMEKKGWHIDRQQKPNTLHAMVTINHKTHYKKYLEDLQEAVIIAKQQPDLAKQGNAAMYGMVAELPLRGLVKNNVLKMMETMYSGEANSFGKDIESIGDNKTLDIGLKLLDVFTKAKAKLNSILRFVK